MTALCCSACIDRLSEKSVEAAQIWVHICQYYVDRGPIGLKEWVHPEVIPFFKLLEEMGYIVTMDGMELIHLRIIGHDKNTVHPDSKDSFCIDRVIHGWSGGVC